MQHKDEGLGYKAMKKKTQDKLFWKFIFYKDNLMLEISLTLSLCIGFSNQDSRTKKLKAVYTLHCILYKILKDTIQTRAQYIRNK